ncbi:MAG: hypothetical protein MUF01_15195 [Bryobacterales bacterium]|jgi:hypothetical protein|nr:hypothetical protein [Bryobacterales bacterium]
MPTAANLTLLWAPIPEDPAAAGLFEIDLDVLNQIEDAWRAAIHEGMEEDSPRVGGTAAFAKALGMSEDSYAESLLRLRAAGQITFTVVEVSA